MRRRTREIAWYRLASSTSIFAGDPFFSVSVMSPRDFAMPSASVWKPRSGPTPSATNSRPTTDRRAGPVPGPVVGEPPGYGSHRFAVLYHRSSPPELPDYPVSRPSASGSRKPRIRVSRTRPGGPPGVRHKSSTGRGSSAAWRSPVADAIRDGHTRTVVPDRLYRSGPFASRNPGAWPGGHHRHRPDPGGSPVASSPVSTNRREMYARARANGGVVPVGRPSRAGRAGRQGGPR